MKVGDLYISQGTDRVQKGHTLVITNLSRQDRIVEAFIVNNNKSGPFTKGYIERNYSRQNEKT